MRRFQFYFAVSMTTLALAGCGKSAGPGSAPQPGAPSIEAQESASPEASAQILPHSFACLNILQSVWDSYADNEKFPSASGDFSDEDAITDGPGTFSATDAPTLNATFGLPEDLAQEIDGIASLTHLMNANTFTGALFHVAEGSDVTDIAMQLKENVLGRQWICGFPDKLMIFTQDNYLLSVFGNEELLETFRQKTAQTHPDMTLLYQENLS